ncbi:carbohydrate-binding family V/XII [Deminuibacter soli]|uniref:Carbohydrate-binding family V/XII n=1 Tax=Deminuibacter soli TaxID=2291815 RepID=A0A3E1NKR8_9BACT|nr:carbohydrate-binding family V/XII [Deminuibacter soli]RFM28512.1 carbohydrate-binding family V/XII [Deminuibacter soli]
MKAITCIVCLFACILQAYCQQQISWPKSIPLNSGGTITVYEPQPEQLSGNKLTGRAAVSIKKNSSADPVFGALWFTADLQTDKDKRTASLESIAITRVKFSNDESQDELDNLTGVIEQEVPRWNLVFSMEELVASVRQEQQLNDPDLNNKAPRILYQTQASTLVLIDGDPILQEDKDIKMERVVNSPFLIVKNPDDKKYYLNAGSFWYSSIAPTAGYTPVTKLPSRIRKLDKTVKSKEDAGYTEDRFTTPTQILVSTEPAELIQTEGEAQFKSIGGTSLLYVDNTLDDIFKDLNTQQDYILLAGRWYRSGSLNGPWTYVAADQLPADFAKIPEGSEKDGVLANVAGTEAAQDALTDAAIPQTAKVERSSAKCTVSYDGAPQFSNIDNTGLAVAENSNITVLRAANGQYYAVDNGVWFNSARPDGPWAVATDRPADVDKIPASNKAYNTRYVYVYDVTPQYIYTGYTPGYLGCYVYGPTVVWGTGWYYRPWYRTYYYPRPFTWGFGMCYNPWTGWNMSFGMSFNFGWLNIGIGTAPGWGGWFGPPAFRPPYRPWGWNGGYYGSRPVIINRPNININRPVYRRELPATRNVNRGNNIYQSRPGVTTRDIQRRPAPARPGTTPGNATRPGNNGGRPINNGRPGTTNPTTPGNNTRPGITNPATSGNSNRPVNNGRPGTTNPTTPGNTTRPGNNARPTVTPPGNQTRPVARPGGGSNNIISDRNGNIYRQDQQGNWQQRDNRNWAPANNNRPPELNRGMQQRGRAQTREQNFNRSQARPAPQRSAPAARPSAPASRPQPGRR